MFDLDVTDVSLFVCLSQSIKAKMEELRPLIPVLEAYKADTLLVRQFKEEATNVTEMLGMLQEQMGGLDYQEIHTQVASLEDRLRACMQKLGVQPKKNRKKTPSFTFFLTCRRKTSVFHYLSHSIPFICCYFYFSLWKTDRNI